MEMRFRHDNSDPAPLPIRPAAQNLCAVVPRRCHQCHRRHIVFGPGTALRQRHLRYSHALLAADAGALHPAHVSGAAQHPPVPFWHEKTGTDLHGLLSVGGADLCPGLFRHQHLLPHRRSISVCRGRPAAVCRLRRADLRRGQRA